MSKLISINDIRENMIVLINTSTSSDRLYFAKVIEVTANRLLRIRSFRSLEIESIVIDEKNYIFKRIRVCDKEEVSKHLHRQEKMFRIPIKLVMSERKRIQNTINQVKIDYNKKLADISTSYNKKLTNMLNMLNKITEREALELRILNRNIDYLKSLENI